MNSIVGHVETIGPYLFRKVKGISLKTIRLNTLDDDFLDVDYLINPESDNFVFICHGLEGSARQSYVLGVARYFYERGFSVVAPNYRSCSGEINLRPRFYHSGETTDIDFVVKKVLNIFKVNQLFFVGFSLGGNMITKYFGEKGEKLHSKISGGAVFSVPLDLKGGSKILNKKFNKVYEQNFLLTLKKKILVKKRKRIITNEIDFMRAMKVGSIWQWDELVTAPLHGFESADDYYEKNSGNNFISKVRRPLYIANAVNDPILTEGAFLDEESLNEYVEFKKLTRGGHVGFLNFKKFQSAARSEKLAFDFFEKINS
ncbi:MAG: alpha/beta hydrolase [Halobacteriovoraceae bacterium]|nr:alpha/beta hydrolase [Halobacteriovoraceae bacterium]